METNAGKMYMIRSRFAPCESAEENCASRLVKKARRAAQ